MKTEHKVTIAMIIFFGLMFWIGSSNTCYQVIGGEGNATIVREVWFCFK